MAPALPSLSYAPEESLLALQPSRTAGEKAVQSSPGKHFSNQCFPLVRASRPSGWKDGSLVLTGFTTQQ